MRAIVVMCFIISAFHVSAQELEFLVSGNTGLFSFTGNNTSRTTQLNYSEDFYDLFGIGVYTSNSYGSRGGLAGGLSASFQRISKRNSILGIQAGYETYQSRVDINAVNTYGTLASKPVTETHEDATGKTNPGYYTINLSPYIGQRIESKLVMYDLNALVEFVHILGTYEKAKAIDASGDLHSFSYSSSTVPSNFKNSNPVFQDLRFGLRLTTYYKRIGITLGYSLGVVNYSYDFGYGENIATSRIARFGVTYKLFGELKNSVTSRQ